MQNCVETDSDEDTPPRQPTADLGPIRRAQVTARELGMNRRTPDTAPLTQSSAAAEASAKHAAPRARAPQRKETRQLGIKDSSLSDDGVSNLDYQIAFWLITMCLFYGRSASAVVLAQVLLPLVAASAGVLPVEVHIIARLCRKQAMLQADRLVAAHLCYPPVCRHSMPVGLTATGCGAAMVHMFPVHLVLWI